MTYKLTKAALGRLVLCAAALAAFAPFGSRAEGQDAAQAAQETPVVSTVESLGVFKNGISLVREKITVPGPGKYAFDPPKDALHGAFFIQSDAVVSATVATSETTVPLDEINDFDWAKDFKGKWLSVKLPGEETARKVRVLKSSDAAPTSQLSAAERNLAAALGYSTAAAERAAGAAKGASDGVLLESESGEIIWLANKSDLGSVVVTDGLPAEFKREKELFVLDVQPAPNTPAQSAVVYLSYLVRGIVWAPQYRVELKDGQTLEIEQDAIVMNDWRDCENVDLVLYSGFPQISLQNVNSPMSAGMTIQSFLASLQNAGSARRNDMAYMTQAALTSNSIGAMGGMGASGAVLPDVSAGDADSVDIYAQQIGKRSVKKGERVLLTVGKASAPYQKVVCWNILDARDPFGRLYDSRNNPRNGAIEATRDERYGQTTSGEEIVRSWFGNSGTRYTEPWDVVYFKNPFEFPITTGPASILSNGRFLAQNSLFWTNPGEETTLPLTKALSVRVKSIENERSYASGNMLNQVAGNAREARREVSYFASQLLPDDWGKVFPTNYGNFRLGAIDASITLTNNRSTESVVRISRQYSGVLDPETLDGFEKKPNAIVMSPNSDWSQRPNPHCELQTEITLKPGETKKLKFTYQSLIRL
ncbi:MAG: hypothetical protein II807_02850 [Thermoguttaceae bacterium]|nr:hypothetical protein [Thermoguttaceae bacterium]